MRVMLVLLGIAAVVLFVAVPAQAATFRLVVCGGGEVLREVVIADPEQILDIVDAVPDEVPVFALPGPMALFALDDEIAMNEILGAAGLVSASVSQAWLIGLYSNGTECLEYRIDPANPEQYANLRAGSSQMHQMYCCITTGACEDDDACKDYRPDCCSGIN